MHKYGREFSLSAIENREACVSERVSSNGMHQRHRFIHMGLRTSPCIPKGNPEDHNSDAVGRTG
jgi:hypothetical protein